MTRNKSVKTVVAKTPPYYREEVWNKLAWLYDPLVKLTVLPFGGEKRFRKKFVDFANPGKDEQVLDVCAGTGTLTSLIAERVGSKGRVTGVDLSATMLRIAREKAGGLAVTFLRADTERLPFPEDIFDKSFVSLGLHEMPETARRNTLQEIYRTLKPGGSLFVLDYNLPGGAFARLVTKAFMRLFEGEVVYEMLLKGSLWAEIEKAGFVIEGQELICGDMVQMCQAGKRP